MRIPARAALTLALLLGVTSVVAAQAEWVTVAPPDMGFTVSFPRTPEHRRTVYPSERGEWVSTSWTVEDTRAESAFQVTVKDYSRYDTSGSSIDRVLDSSCLGIDPDARVSPLAGATLPARRCLSDVGVGGTEMIVLWSAPRLYIVAQICGRAPCDQAARRRFLGSFRVR